MKAESFSVDEVGFGAYEVRFGGSDGCFMSSEMCFGDSGCFFMASEVCPGDSGGCFMASGVRVEGCDGCFGSCSTTGWVGGVVGLSYLIMALGSWLILLCLICLTA